MVTRVEGAGVELATTVQGTGRPVLLVHDLAADARAWAPLRDALDGHARTIAYDRRGYGASGAPQPYERTTVHEQAQDAQAVLAAFDAADGEALAVGDGFGALIVLDLLVRTPGLLAGAVLVAPPVNQLAEQATAVLSDQRELLEAALRDGGPAVAVEAWRPGADDAVRAAHRAFFADFGGLASWPVSRRELRAIAVPTVVVTGSATPPHLIAVADALAELVPTARRQHGGAAEGDGLGDPLPALRELLADAGSPAARFR